MVCDIGCFATIPEIGLDTRFFSWSPLWLLRNRYLNLATLPPAEMIIFSSSLVANTFPVMRMKSTHGFRIIEYLRLLTDTFYD